MAILYFVYTVSMVFAVKAKVSKQTHLNDNRERRQRHSDKHSWCLSSLFKMHSLTRL